MIHSRMSARLSYRRALLAGMSAFLPAPFFGTSCQEQSAMDGRFSGGRRDPDELVRLLNVEGPFC